MSIAGATNDDSTRYCFRTLPACPACGSIDFSIYKTQREDGGKVQWAKCGDSDCENKFKIVWDVPLGGIHDGDLD